MALIGNKINLPKSVTINLLLSFSSSSEPDQSDLRGIRYSVGHCFPAGVHIAQYPGDIWDNKGQR